MSNKHGSKWIRPAKRARIYKRDGHRCIYCRTTLSNLTLDHLLPRSLGGTNDASNLVTACVFCNSERRNLTIRQWFTRLRGMGVDTDKIRTRVRNAVRRKI